MPTSITERRHAGSFVVSEQEGFMSRDEITVTNLNADPDGDDLKLEAGTVLGVITAGNSNSDSLGAEGDYAALLETQTDGTQTAAGILYGELILAPGETKKVAIISRLAEVRISDLTWPSTYDDANITAALAILAASPYFIIGRPPENNND